MPNAIQLSRLQAPRRRLSRTASTAMTNPTMGVPLTISAKMAMDLLTNDVYGVRTFSNSTSERPVLFRIDQDVCPFTSRRVTTPSTICITPASSPGSDVAPSPPTVIARNSCG